MDRKKIITKKWIIHQVNFFYASKKKSLITQAKQLQQEPPRPVGEESVKINTNLKIISESSIINSLPKKNKDQRTDIQMPDTSSYTDTTTDCVCVDTVKTEKSNLPSTNPPGLQQQPSKSKKNLKNKSQCKQSEQLLATTSFPEGVTEVESGTKNKKVKNQTKMKKNILNPCTKLNLEVANEIVNENRVEVDGPSAQLYKSGLEYTLGSKFGGIASTADQPCDEGDTEDEDYDPDWLYEWSDDETEPN